MLRSPQSTLYQIKGIIIFTTGIGEKKTFIGNKAAL